MTFINDDEKEKAKIAAALDTAIRRSQARIHLLHSFYLGLLFVMVMHYGASISLSLAWEVCLTAWAIDAMLLVAGTYVKRWL